MTVTEALQVVQAARHNVDPFHVVLACGFTPLHVRTFLAAHMQGRLPTHRVTIETGLYGDTAGTLEAARDTAVHAIAVIVEWADLDPRLGYRGSGAWGPGAAADIVSSGRAALARLAAAIENLPAAVPVAVSLPSLSLPPLFHTPGWQASEADLALRHASLEFAMRVARRDGLRVVSPERLAEESAAVSRYDMKADLLTGLPYGIAHADALSAALARVLVPPAVRKGLITDLDDTLWHGIVGEVGPEKVSWDLARRHHLHGLYQRMLAALAEEGVLIGIASKNDRTAVDAVLKRPDLLLPAQKVFPVEVHWNAKSGSVSRILSTWNIAADSVVFVDDSPMELAEVAAAHPGMECIRFPKDDYAAAYDMLRRLRDLFGKPRLSHEDSIRLESIRQGAVFQEAAEAGPASEAFLEGAHAVVSFDFSLPSRDARVLELVNKTNQFNLNGIRYTPAEWDSRLQRPGAFLAAVSYHDRFGPLGTIAIIQGYVRATELCIDTWVMSCRAFSRRIEHQCLRTLLDRFPDVVEVFLEFRPTAKNNPLATFFTGIAGNRPDAPFLLLRKDFDAACPPLYHSVKASSEVLTKWTTQSLV